jgi:hypothetical protein
MLRGSESPVLQSRKCPWRELLPTTLNRQNAARDEILQRRPELRGKSLEAMRRILRREARLSLRPKRSVKSD